MLFVAARVAQWLPLLTEGQQSGHKGAVTFLLDLLAVSELLGDKGHDIYAYRAALMERDITPCIPLTANANIPQHTIKSYTSSATKSKTCLPNSKVGDA